jgi:dimethylargininase
VRRYRHNRAMNLIALTRAVPPSMADCELTHLDREPIDINEATKQHASYEEALRALGCRVERLEATPSMPDSVFVEDTAVVLDELAVITRPGADSRRAETASVAAALRRYRTLFTITEPGTIDGGDVLRVGRRIFIGISTRTSEAAVAQFTQFVEPYGYSVTSVGVRGVLHLKSAVTQLGTNELVINRERVDDAAFSGYDLVDVDPSEPDAANALLIGEHVVFPSDFPRTLARIEARGFVVTTVDAGELAKAEGALTCCSLIVRA